MEEKSNIKHSKFKQRKEENRFWTAWNGKKQKSRRRKMKTRYWVLAVFLVAVALAACGGEKDTNSEEGILAKIGLPADYFPTPVGWRWEYNVQASEEYEKSPLSYEIVHWPLGNDNSISYRTRGILMGGGSEKKVATKKLILEVAAMAVKQGPFQYPEGYRLKVVRDDMEYFGEAEDILDIFWTISQSRRYSVDQVVTYSPSSSRNMNFGNPWGGYGSEPGYAMRVVFFGSKPNVAIGLSGSGDRLYFIDFENFQGKDALHFQRQVEADTLRLNSESNLASNRLSSAFTEDVWYIKGQGLSKLIQKVNSEITMVWDLVRFYNAKSP